MLTLIRFSLSYWKKKKLKRKKETKALKRSSTSTWRKQRTADRKSALPSEDAEDETQLDAALEARLIVATLRLAGREAPPPPWMHSLGYLDFIRTRVSRLTLPGRPHATGGSCDRCSVCYMCVCGGEGGRTEKRWCNQMGCVWGTDCATARQWTQHREAVLHNPAVRLFLACWCRHNRSDWHPAGSTGQGQKVAWEFGPNDAPEGGRGDFILTWFKATIKGILRYFWSGVVWIPCQ